MTRFARAKGSKASNEKLPEEPTSWSEMKQDLLKTNMELAEKKNREAALQKRQDNYKAFLDDIEEEENKNIEWADFPAPESNKQSKASKRKFAVGNNGISNAIAGMKRVKKQVRTELEGASDSEDEEFSALKSQIDKVLAENKNDSDCDSEPPEEVGTKETPKEIVIKKQKSKKAKQKLKITVEKNNAKAEAREINISKQGQTKVERLISKKHDRRIKQMEKKKLKKQKQQEEKQKLGEHSRSTQAENCGLDETKTAKKLERRKKQKEKKKNYVATNVNANSTEVDAKDTPTEEDLKNIERKKQRRARQIEKRQKFKELKAAAQEANHSTDINKTGSDSQIHDEETDMPSTPNNKFARKNLNNNHKAVGKDTDANQPNTDSDFATKKQTGNQKQAKDRDNKNHSSRKQKSETMHLNGETIEIGYVDGFPVKKEDARRLETLRKEMISKGLPRSEIKNALKLERRRAERAFARSKKTVCFKCRKSGHQLSECPELEKDQMADTSGTGICFKCGSTEHTHYECKAVRGMDYKFASCFICKEQGHIAKQCPDNQRGLYANGGACKVCGDVTHLKKDCPKYQAQQAQLRNSMSIGTLDNDNPDAMDVNGPANSFNGAPKKVNKIIKF